MSYHAALNLIYLLSKCPCDVCKKEIMRLEDKWGLTDIQKVNKAESKRNRERLNEKGQLFGISE